MSNNHKPPFIRNRCVKEIIEGIHTKSTACKAYKVSRRTVYNWLDASGVKYKKRVGMIGNKNACKNKKKVSDKPRLRNDK